MIESEIQKICEHLSVKIECYKKVHDYLQKSSLCRICFHPISKNPDFEDLRWVGDEHVLCCGDPKCEEQIKKLDILISKLGSCSGGE